MVRDYFRLNTYCYLLSGVEGGCIYNVATGDMLAIDINKYNFLKQCENNTPLNQVEALDKAFLDELFHRNVGMYHNAPVYIDKFYIGIHPQMEQIMPPNYLLSNAFLELDTTCNFDCVFCRKNDNVLFRKTGCKRWKTESIIADIDIWKDIIGQIAKLGCKQITFIGGEPLLRINDIQELASYIRSQGIQNIMVFTNGTLLNTEILSVIKAYDMELNVQLLANSSETYEQITGVPNSEKIVFANISQLASSGVNFTLSYLVSRFNEDEVQDAFMRYTPIAGSKNMKLEYLYPVPYNDFYSERFIEAMYDRKRALRKVDVATFCHVAKYHNCYGHGIAVTAEGNILPCIMSRTLVLGNVKYQSIISILANSKYDYYHRLTKDKVQECKGCAYRYGCFDCRALEVSATGIIEGLEYCNLKYERKLSAVPISSTQSE